MKTQKLKWNLGIIVIRLGYLIRKYQHEPKFYSLRWAVGVIILKYGYLLRGQTPYLTWKWNHI